MNENNKEDLCTLFSKRRTPAFWFNEVVSRCTRRRRHEHVDAHLNDAPPGHHFSYKALHIFGQAPFSQECRVGVVSEMRLVFLVRLFSVFLI